MLEKKYNNFICAKDNQEFLSSATRPRCPKCGTHKVNPAEKKIEQEIKKKNEVENMPKEKKPDEENNKKPIDREDDDDDSFTIY